MGEGWGGRSTRKHSEALKSTWKHSEALGGTRKHSEALGSTRKHLETLEGTRKHSEAHLPQVVEIGQLVDKERAHLGRERAKQRGGKRGRKSVGESARDNV